jgi:putative tricarboxylic transport membrane protein
MLAADRILGIIFLLLASACLAEGIRVWDGMGETGFLPVIMGIVFGALAPGFLFSRSSHRESFQIPWPAKGNRQKIALVYLSLMLYTLLVPWMGYFIGTTLFLIGLVRAMGSVRWGYGLFFSLATSSCTYLIFKVWLKMPLPGGFLGV